MRLTVPLTANDPFAHRVPTRLDQLPSTTSDQDAPASAYGDWLISSVNVLDHDRVTVGAPASTTVTVLVAVAVFPDGSV